MESEVRVEIATAAEKDVIVNLFQLYIHDFSELWRGRPEGELEPDGRFAHWAPLDRYWSEEGRVPLLLRRAGALIGFALVNAVGHEVGPLDRNMAEFFIVRKYRRGGAGMAAARTIFARYPGLWEVAVARANLAALSFWREAIGGCPGVHDIDERDLATEAWDGALFRFRI